MQDNPQPQKPEILPPQPEDQIVCIKCHTKDFINLTQYALVSQTLIGKPKVMLPIRSMIACNHCKELLSMDMIPLTMRDILPKQRTNIIPFPTPAAALEPDGRINASTIGNIVEGEPETGGLENQPPIGQPENGEFSGGAYPYRGRVALPDEPIGGI